MIERANGKQFSKRVVFDHSQYDNFLGQIIEARDEKKQADDELKAKTLKDGFEEMKKH